MTFQPSTSEELQACADFVQSVREDVRRLVASGKKVHFVWDVDHVLAAGRSDDVFSHLKFAVPEYFRYEERLITQLLEKGPWAELARECGTEGMQVSQDVVTARSSFLAMRVMFFLLEHRIPIRWQLFVGHQPKADSYRIILKWFEKDPDMHIFSVDDAKKHNDAFDAIAAELGMSERCRSILGPQVRRYVPEDIAYEAEHVLKATGHVPIVLHPRTRDGLDYMRFVRVTPDPYVTMANMLWRASAPPDERAFVEENRDTLERLVDEMCPDRKKTDALLIVFREMGMMP
ncbi:MAG: hypothetical protein QY323_00015 [Patescibacteria group bacterium]|nr:MAG: hypothetical protein QY323_00015 [Patescibacteria group bacterium]